MNLNNIKILLQDISEFEILEIINNSEKHMGHAGVEKYINHVNSCRAQNIE